MTHLCLIRIVAAGVILAHGGTVCLHRKQEGGGGYSCNGFTVTIPLYTTSKCDGEGPDGIANEANGVSRFRVSPAVSSRVRVPGEVMSIAPSMFQKAEEIETRAPERTICRTSLQL